MLVRLSELPESLLRRYGNRLIRDAASRGDLLGAVEIKNAVKKPSQKPYKVSDEAFWRVMSRYQETAQ